MAKASIGVSAHLGWAAISIITVHKGGFRVLHTDRIETAEAGDREALEPYHIAGGFRGLARVPAPSDPGRVITRGLRKQQRHTSKALQHIEKLLESQGHRITCGAILVSRGRSAETLEKAVGSHTQVHIEEGNAVRESIRRALVKAGNRVHDIDRKTVSSIASEELATKESELFASLDEAKPEGGGPWRKEEKTAALAAWIAWARGSKG